MFREMENMSWVTRQEIRNDTTTVPFTVNRHIRAKLGAWLGSGMILYTEAVSSQKRRITYINTMLTLEL